MRPKSPPLTITFMKCQFPETIVFRQFPGNFLVLTLISLRKEVVLGLKHILAKKLLFPIYITNLGVA